MEAGTAGIAISIARAALTAGFEQVPEGHNGTTPFTLHLAFSEPVESDRRDAAAGADGDRWHR